MAEKDKAPDQKPKVRIDFKAYFSELISDFFHLEKGVDKWGTIREIKSKQSMSGANAWMLLCSIMIASIGLNLNSQAVIIGAMLISPLMSPILGIGLAVAINDKDALYHALLHFFSAIIIALLASFIYFRFTPLNELTEQILARTEPTFLDVLIAIFGGIAGIVSIARKDISTTLPGVAIATALMPPLCVAGFGLANASIEIASKAFYLFFLNTFFVALSTYVILRVMKFPFKEYATPRDRKKNLWMVGVFSVLMIVPSFLIFSNVFKKYKEKEKLNSFIKTYIGDNQKYLDDYDLFPNENGVGKTLVMKVYGDSINRNQMPEFNKGLAALDMKNVSVEIIPTSEINLKKVRQLETEMSAIGDRMNNQIKQLVEEKAKMDDAINERNMANDFFNQDSIKFSKVCMEIKNWLPDIMELDLAVAQHSDFNSIKSRIPTAIVKWDSPKANELNQLKNHLKNEYQLDTIRIIVTQ